MARLPSELDRRGGIAKKNAERDPMTVILSPEPPALTPGAARALLRILVKAYEKQTEDEVHTSGRRRQRPGDQ